MSTENTLFTPLTLNKLTLKNRTIYSATWSNRGEMGTGNMTPQILSYYRKIAEGETGLIIVEHTAVNEEGLAQGTMLRLFDDKHIIEHRKLVDTVHAVPGAKIFSQLNCAGGMGTHPNRYGPSDATMPYGVGRGKEMTLEQIKHLPEDFAAAALRAKEAGYDGVQIHSAHVYLLASFLSPMTNRRTDMYGGSLENRSRLTIEVCKAVRKAVGPDYPVCMKINCNDFAAEDGLQPHETGWIIKQLEGILDFVELSGGTRFGAQWVFRTGTYHDDPMHELWYARELAIISRITKMPLAVVGGIRTPAGAQRAFDAGAVLVSMSRPIVRHPDLVKCWKEGIKYTPCVSCSACARKLHYGRWLKCWVKYAPFDTDPYKDEKEE